MNFNDYATQGFFDEMFTQEHQARPGADLLSDRLGQMDLSELNRSQEAAMKALVYMGITFQVYNDNSSEGVERVLPFDIIPRVVEQKEWDWIERGLKQRIQALNLFIDDIYGQQKILDDGIVPRELILSCKSYQKNCVGFKPPLGVWAHISGIDLVRDSDGQIYILEDNLRCPSGVSYVLENRAIMKETFPNLFDRVSIQPVDDYASRLLESLQAMAPPNVMYPNVAVLTPGIYNSAYYEHSYLAQHMGVELVEGKDLVVADKVVYMRTTGGFERVDVIYRRIDDDFLDPLAFRPDSVLGVPGLFEAYLAGNVALANAPGTGIADDKVIYAYVPRIIKYYLGEEAIIPNVPTHICGEPESLTYVLDNLDKLVVKPASESGGYGLLIGPAATQKERDEFAEAIKANPRNYIAQPTLSLSRVPTVVKDGIAGRHVDLRPYILYGKDIYVLPGGLTRVALKEGSLVVNSSQGGGTKDTWVVDSGMLAPDEATV